MCQRGELIKPEAFGNVSNEDEAIRKVWWRFRAQFTTVNKVPSFKESRIIFVPIDGEFLVGPLSRVPIYLVQKILQGRKKSHNYLSKCVEFKLKGESRIPRKEAINSDLHLQCCFILLHGLYYWAILIVIQSAISLQQTPEPIESTCGIMYCNHLCKVIW